ncbi:MAG: sugar ABC transporter ATP-binding protein [Spirochaetaceae bacterium]|nr:sugar ABC transporter ATP-binding protein [Spirochaetaceae bacterium]MDT8297561.1 sugar ABC transporter ATP-binding protein [Spirochaetaceae bacterium]
MSDNTALLRAENISKRYGGVQALDAVDLEVQSGEVHAVVGENGAGKSTLIKILSGIVKRDSGTIVLDGREVEYSDPKAAFEDGIAVIHQELSMLPHMNVIENIYMGKMKNRWGLIDWKTLEKGTRDALGMVGMELDPHTLVGDLSISQRQMIEIAKAVHTKARIIIMDEPNSSLCDWETEKLFEVIEKLQKEGIAIVYISHKLDEVLRISDYITVFRDGKNVGRLPRDEATVNKMITLMVGRNLNREGVRRRVTGGLKLSARNLTGEGFSSVSFDLKEGEILGFSGLVGAGRSEVARAIFGAQGFDDGEITLRGKSVRFRNPAEAIRAGLAMVPEDRKKLSLFMDMSISFNMAMANLFRMKKGVVIDEAKQKATVGQFVDNLRIKLGQRSDPVRSLSGGNQQKTILGRWLATEPDILILDEPTHGVDIGAKADIYALIRELAEKGKSIILISSEMPEIIAMSDRVIVMTEGRVSAELSDEDITEENIMAAAAHYEEQ